MAIAHGTAEIDVHWGCCEVENKLALYLEMCFSL